MRGDQPLVTHQIEGLLSKGRWKDTEQVGQRPRREVRYDLDESLQLQFRLHLLAAPTFRQYRPSVTHGKARVHINRLLCSNRRLVILVQVDPCDCDGLPCEKLARVYGTEPQQLSRVCDRCLRFTSQRKRHAMVSQRDRQIGIELRCLIERRTAAGYVMRGNQQRPSGISQHPAVVAVENESPTGILFGLFLSIGALLSGSTAEYLRMGSGKQRMRIVVIRIKTQSLHQQWNRLSGLGWRIGEHMGECAKHVVVSV